MGQYYGCECCTDSQDLDRAALSWGPMPAAFMAEPTPNDKCICRHPRREHKDRGICLMASCSCERFEAAPDAV